VGIPAKRPVEEDDVEGAPKRPTAAAAEAVIESVPPLLPKELDVEGAPKRAEACGGG